MSTTKLHAQCTSFSRFSIPHLEKEGIRNYYALVDVDSLFDLSEWRETNVRDARASGYVPSRIQETLSTSLLFPIINRGLVISAKDVHWDNRENILTIELDDADIHGLIDGGHTYLQLDRYKSKDAEMKRLIEPQYVKVEILSGLDRAKMVDIVDGRNTSTQVKQQSLEELKDTFQGIKDAVKKQNYAHLISYAEHEVYQDAEGKEVKKPIPIYDILKALTCFDKSSFNDFNHPVNVVMRDAKVLDHFKNNLKKVEPIYPILHDILKLWDTIGRDFVSCYRNAGGQAYKIGQGDERHFKKLKKGAHKMYFLDDKAEWWFADSLRYPALAAFRAALGKKGDAYRWDAGIEPCSFFTQVVGAKLTKVICGSLLETQDPHRTSKTESVWQSCYDAVENAILKQK